MTTLRSLPRPGWLLALGGFLLGCAALLLIRAIGIALLPGACQGRTILGLLPPLLLGPGGIATATTQISRGRAPALGIGLAISSLFPALALGVRDIGELRTIGCAGGYVVFGTPSGGRLPEVTILPGQTVDVTVRPGGFQNKFGPVSLSAKLPTTLLSVAFAQERVDANQTAVMHLSASGDAPAQQYTVAVIARQQDRGADGQLTVTVRPKGARK
ncbi:hypothetical protein [Deinococcus sp.]|uniref:hypothetical protein n=1 Tax=Deinococcus sp. TaxID=47478 RepID=UPI0025E60D97|nr:hypothetical protein [Deinococcus sp.]